MAQLIDQIDATSFAYLHIPSDTGKPIAERRARMNTCLEDDVLREDICALLTATHGRATGTDTFVLTLPTAKSDHLAVSLYSDGDAVNRGLPKNARASGLCAACGFPLQEFHGDVFISRYFDDDVSGGEAWLRRDLTLAECSSDAAWVRAAAAGRGAGRLAELALGDELVQASGPAAAAAPRRPCASTRWAAAATATATAARSTPRRASRGRRRATSSRCAARARGGAARARQRLAREAARRGRRRARRRRRRAGARSSTARCTRPPRSTAARGRRGRGRRAPARRGVEKPPHGRPSSNPW